MEEHNRSHITVTVSLYFSPWNQANLMFLSRVFCLFPDPSVPKLPAWLQTLLACCFEAEEFDIQSSAVGTLLDLINLTLSVTSPGVATRPKANTAVVVIPMISQHSLELIERSVVYEVCAIFQRKEVSAVERCPFGGACMTFVLAVICKLA